MLISVALYGGQIDGDHLMCSSLKRHSRLIRTAVLASALGISAAPTSTYAISDQEAQEIAVDAYVYFYPLVSLDVTRKQFTNFEPGKVPGRGPMNMFNNVPTYPPADDKGVVRFNFDTLYSSAFLDLTKEPRLCCTDRLVGAGGWVA